MLLFVTEGRGVLAKMLLTLRCRYIAFLYVSTCAPLASHQKLNYQGVNLNHLAVKTFKGTLTMIT